MTQNQNVKLVIDYFDACNTGDLSQLTATLAEDVVHYFLPAAHIPIRGSEHLANYWRKFKKLYHPNWKIDHTIASGNEVVSEWSCSYTRPVDGERMIFRGTEWYIVFANRISEIRAYYHYDEKMDCQLSGFPYLERKYLTR